MKRKIVSLLMVLALVLSVAGCAPKQTPKEMLEEAIMNGLEIESAEQDMNMHLSLDLGENPDPMVEMFASMLSDVNVDFHAKSMLDGETPKLEMTGSAALSGMTYNVEVYMNESQMAMKIPMMDQYIVQDVVSEDGAQVTMGQEEAKEISKKIYTAILSKVTDEELVVEENAATTINEKEVKLTNVSLSLDDARTKEMIKEIFNEMFTDEAFREIMINSQKSQYEAYDMEMTEEEIAAELDEVVTSFNEGWEEAITYFNVNTFDMTFGIDGSNQIVATKMALDMDVNEPESGTEMKLAFDVDTSVYNINNVKELFFPELTEENSVTADEMGGMGF